jgi:hypothetical protein
MVLLPGKPAEPLLSYTGAETLTLTKRLAGEVAERRRREGTRLLCPTEASGYSQQGVRCKSKGQAGIEARVYVIPTQVSVLQARSR